MVSSNSWVPVTGVSSILGCQHAAEAHDFGMKAQQRHVQSRVFARPPVVHGACYNVEPSVALTLSWVISHVPIFHITQPLGIWSFLWLLFWVMSNIPQMGQLPTPVYYMCYK